MTPKRIRRATADLAHRTHDGLDAPVGDTDEQGPAAARKIAIIYLSETLSAPYFKTLSDQCITLLDTFTDPCRRLRDSSMREHRSWEMPLTSSKKEAAVPCG